MSAILDKPYSHGDTEREFNTSFRICMGPTICKYIRSHIDDFIRMDKHIVDFDLYIAAFLDPIRDFLNNNHNIVSRSELSKVITNELFQLSDLVQSPEMHSQLCKFIALEIPLDILCLNYEFSIIKDIIEKGYAKGSRQMELADKRMAVKDRFLNVHTTETQHSIFKYLYSLLTIPELRDEFINSGYCIYDWRLSYTFKHIIDVFSDKQQVLNLDVDFINIMLSLTTRDISQLVSDDSVLTEAILKIIELKPEYKKDYTILNALFLDSSTQDRFEYLTQLNKTRMCNIETALLPELSTYTPV